MTLSINAVSVTKIEYVREFCRTSRTNLKLYVSDSLTAMTDSDLFTIYLISDLLQYFYAAIFEIAIAKTYSLSSLLLQEMFTCSSCSTIAQLKKLHLKFIRHDVIILSQVRIKYDYTLIFNCVGIALWIFLYLFTQF
jgi:hypothetical protein